MIVLDTNVVSEAYKPKPDANVVEWLSRQDDLQLYISAPTIMEQSYGAELLLRRTGSTRYKRALRRLRDKYSGRMLNFVGEAPELAGILLARREARGRPVSIGDAMIAAICLVNGATLATRNVRDFAGLDLKLINPFEASA
jgi:hypothetical protein